MGMKRLTSIFLLIFMLLSIASCVKTEEVIVKWDIPENDQKRFDAVMTYLNNVLENGKDTITNDEKKKATPLFYDGINTKTNEPYFWNTYDKRWTKTNYISNFAFQQNLFRALNAMTEITGDKKYYKAAADATNYMFKNFKAKSGLLYEGGHTFIDLETMKIWGPSEETVFHEYKFAGPAYDFMYKVNPEETKNNIASYFGMHVKDWNRLSVNRHGRYDVLPKDSQYANAPKAEYPVMYFTRDLTFINAASDLVRAGAYDFMLTGNENALKWSKAIAKQFISARHPDTGLGGFQYTIYMTTNLEDPPLSADRVQANLMPEIGAYTSNPDNAIEPYFLIDWAITCRYATYDAEILQLGKMLGENGKEYVQWAVEDLKALTKWSWNAEKRCFTEMLADGSSLEGFKNPRDGYFGGTNKTYGDVYDGDGRYMTSFVRGAILSNDTELWGVAKALGENQGLGDLGTAPGEGMALNMETQNASYYVLDSVLELYDATKKQEYLDLARKIGDNIADRYYVDGYFRENPEDQWVDFGKIQPIILLKLHSYIIGKPELASYNVSAETCYDGGFMLDDGSTINIYGNDLTRRLNQHYKR